MLCAHNLFERLAFYDKLYFISITNSYLTLKKQKKLDKLENVLFNKIKIV